MFGLEYLLLFGLPENKLENLYEGRARLGQAFATPEEALAQYLFWAEELAVWQGVAGERCGCDGPTRTCVFGRFWLWLEACCVHLFVPLNWGMHYNSRVLESRREVWSEHSGWELSLRRMTVWSNGLKIFGKNLHGTELLLTPESMVSPVAYLGGRVVRGSYLEGAPELVWEELSCASEAQLRGQKLRLYFEAGVKELWYLQADSQRIQVLRRRADGFDSVGWFGLADELSYGGIRVQVAAVFEGAVSSGEDEFWEERESAVGLQQVVAGGLPWRRFEYWDGWCRRFLPCRSLEQALRVGESLRVEIERWDSGRFRLHQRGQVLELATRVDAGLHREFLDLWHFRGRWAD